MGSFHSRGFRGPYTVRVKELSTAPKCLWVKILIGKQEYTFNVIQILLTKQLPGLDFYNRPNPGVFELNNEHIVLLWNKYKTQIANYFKARQRLMIMGNKKARTFIFKNHKTYRQNLTLKYVRVIEQYIGGPLMHGEYAGDRFRMTTTDHINGRIVLPTHIKNLQKFQNIGVPVISERQNQKEFFTTLYQALRKAPQINQKMWVYRGATLPNLTREAIGSTLPHPSFLSTTLMKEFAVNWLHGAKCCLWAIEIDLSKIPCLYVSIDMGPFEEFELIVAPVYLRILDVKNMTQNEVFERQELDFVKMSRPQHVSGQEPIRLVVAQAVKPKKVWFSQGQIRIS